jgi:methionine-S-sulfoxide reductase
MKSLTAIFRFLLLHLLMLGTFAFGFNVQAAPSAVKTESREKAIFAAGCFWGVEEFFRKVPGVVETGVGYSGGAKATATYSEVSAGTTGHAESVEVIFDPEKVTYEHLLDLFFKIHDPTTLNRQGNDRGSQYRSAIFYLTPKQKETAERFKTKVDQSKAWSEPVVTEISSSRGFFEAEEEHQKYLLRNPKGYDNHYLRKISFEKKQIK